MRRDPAATGGPARAWVLWAAGSSLAHAILLGVCLLGAPAAGTLRDPLRVRLVSDVAPVPRAPAARPPGAPRRHAAETRPVRRRPAPLLARVDAPPPLPRDAASDLAEAEPEPRTPPPAPPAQTAAPAPPASPAPLPPASAPAAAAPSPAPLPPAATAPPPQRPDPGPVAAFGSGGRGVEASAPPRESAGGSEKTAADGGRGDEWGAGEHLAARAPARGIFFSASAAAGATGGYAAGGGSGGEPGVNPDGRRLRTGQMSGAGAVASAGSGSGGGAAETGGLLRAIRRRIEDARVYPERARETGVQGTVELRFRIAGDGAVAAFEILRSSGSSLLDAASEEAIRRAAPFPVVSGWIRLPLAYRLERDARR